MTQTLEWTEEQWQDPGSIFRAAPFWSWNDRMEPERLRRQVRRMHEAGMGGFFMHSRYGLKTAYLSEEWFACISACVEEARRLGMKAYLYDEDRWPSGAAGGLVTRERPELSRHVLAAFGGAQPPEGLDRQGAFAARLDEAGRLVSFRAVDDGAEPEPGETAVRFAAGPVAPRDWFNEAGYLDTLSAEAVAEFIRITHQAYADRYGEDFGELIPGIFTDEPNFGHGGAPSGAEDALAVLPWTAELPREFRRRRGYDLRDHLPELVFPLADGPFSPARHDYYRTLTELFAENFSAQIGRWCANHNIALTGHYLAEGDFAGQIAQIGAAMPHYEHQQWPGIDILTDQVREVATAKQAAGVADQLGRRRVLSELYGCTGWDWPLEGHKFNGGWQYVLGVNFRCPHLSLYSLAGGAKRDYPASIFPHSPWWKHYRVVEDYFARLGLMLTRGRPVRDVLLLHTVESAWGMRLPGEQPEPMAALWDGLNDLLELLLDSHYDCDLGDESILAGHARVASGRLKVGRMEYRLVVVPPSVTLRASTLALLKRFQASGGHVLFVGRVPDRVDGRDSAAPADFVEQAVRCGTEPDVVAATVEDLLPRRLSLTEDGSEATCVWAMLRQVKGGRLLFVQGRDRDADHDLRVSVEGRRPVVRWDPVTGRRERVDSEKIGDRVEFDLHLPPTGSALISLGVRVPPARRAGRRRRRVEALPAPPPWPVELLEPNVLPLDYCHYRVGDDDFGDWVPVMYAEDRIRQRFGLAPRRNRGCQPWYLAATDRADRRKRGRCELRFGFHVTSMPDALTLAVERPEDFQIVLNGRELPSDPIGWWIDEDIKTVDLGEAFGPGDNVLLLRFDYSSDMELEDLHLLGRFGVRTRGEQRTPDAYTLTAPPEELAAGSWVGQGLDFYGGAVAYRVGVPDGVWRAVRAGRRVRLALPGVRCTCAAVHVGDATFVLPWPPMAADVTDALLARSDEPCDEVTVEVIGGRHNTFGPLHVPWLPWTGPGEFDPAHKQWSYAFLLNDHGLTAPPSFEILE